MIDKISVGKRISELRKSLGYTQAVFAKKLNVSTQAVSKWETGLALPDIEVLLAISWIGRQSINTLLEGEDYAEPQSGMDRGMAFISKYLLCPQCRNPLVRRFSEKEKKLSFACPNGHCFDASDGVLYFGTREVKGELWSLWLRNYEHYLEEQRHPGNPRYWQGEPNFREIMWDKIEKLRPRTILDIACGTGSGIKYMIERITWPVTVIMTDLSHRILKWNRIFYSEEWKNPYVDMVYLACDCSRLPLKDGCVDLVFSNGGFESMRTKMQGGFEEAYRVLRPGAHAVYNMSLIEEPGNENTKRWLRLYRGLDDDAHAEENKLYDVNQWLETCRKTGFHKNETVKVYGELPPPETDKFPFENEILQWMAEYVVVSEK